MPGHDDSSQEQRADHHTGGPAGRVRAGDGRGRGVGARRRAARAGHRRRRRHRGDHAGLPRRPAARPRHLGRRRDQKALTWICCSDGSSAPASAAGWAATGTGSSWPGRRSSCAGSSTTRSGPVSTLKVAPGRAAGHHGARPQDTAPAGRRRLNRVGGTLAAGERVLLVDPKDRRYLLTLVAGASFHTHAGVLAHDDIIGATEGCTVTGSTGRGFLVLRPTLSDIVLKMPRGAQVIYPKDLGRHPHRRRHRARLPRARGGGRLGCALHDRAARRRLRGRLRAARGLRRAGPRQRARRPGSRHRPTGSRSATSLRASTSATSIGSSSTCPNPTTWSPPRRRRSARAGSCWPTCPPSTRPRCCARRWPRRPRPSVWRRRRRSSAAPGTSRPARCGRTTAWWATPDS